MASVGILRISPIPISGGQPINVTVVDPDLNYSPTRAETGQVTLQTLSDTETITVTETGLNTNVFTGTIATRLGIASTAGVLTGLTEGEIVLGTYRDAIPDSTRFECLTCITRTLVAMVANLTLSPSLLDVDGTLTVTVVDSDANLNRALIDTTLVTVSQTYRQPVGSRVVTVTETGTDTSIFTGSLRTSSSTTSGLLYAPQGARITASYNDTNPTPSSVRTATSRIASVGTVTLSPSPLNPNGTLIVTVDDADLDISAGPDQTGVGSVVVKSATDFFNPVGHTLVLLENGASTGIFTGTILTRTPAGTQAGLPVDNAKSGTEIEAEYMDSAPAGKRTAIVRVATVGTLSVTPETLESGRPMSIVVTDEDLNLNRTLVEQATVAVRQSSTSGATVIQVRDYRCSMRGACAPTNIVSGRMM
jgi:hypothetical protein